MTEDAGFFRNLAGYATEVVRQRRKALQREPQTNVDSTGGGNRHTFGGQELSWDDLRDIKDIRDSGGQVAQLMEYKTLLNFGEGAEVHVEDNEATTEMVDGDELTLQEWLEQRAFPKLDLLVLDLGADALWYPYAVGELQETVTGDFKRALPAEPHTLMPQTDEQGEVVAWNQRTKSRGGGYREQTLSADDLWHIVVNKSNARDETGISEVLRNREEIQAFKQNEEAINQAIELHGFPQRHVKVGKEDGAPVRDDDLRRVRTIFDPRTTDANTAYFTGRDVDVESLEAESFDFGAVHEMDMRNLTTALGLPLEAGNVGADGLGSGKPAELRFALLKLAIKANQRSFAVQFVERVMRPVIRDYSPFDHTATITLDIGDPLEDIGEVADLINSVGDYMTNEEVREKLDMPAPEDDEIAEAYRSPADVEAPEDEGGPFGGDGGFFRDGADGRKLAEVPDNAVSISDRSEAPEDAQVITGPGGGLYYVPSGGEDGDDSVVSDGGLDDTAELDELAEQSESTQEFAEAVSTGIEEQTGIQTELDASKLDEGQITNVGNVVKSLAVADSERMNELGDYLENGIQTIDNENKEFIAVFDPDSESIKINAGKFKKPDEIGEDVVVAREDHFREDTMIHEIGHAFHQMEFEESDIRKSQAFGGGGVSEITNKEVSEHLSAYADTTRAEFVAEMFLHRSLGNDDPVVERETSTGSTFEYPDLFSDKYDELRGPEAIVVGE
jgi:hypothetical protein